MLPSIKNALYEETMKVLLLNTTYEGISFVSFRKAMKLYFKDKVEILSYWDDVVSWSSGEMKIPAVIRLKYYVRWIPRRVRLNRQGIFRRDRQMCQYCGSKQGPFTIDHIIPVSQNGTSTWINCTTSCNFCNNKKGNRTPEQANMVLLSKPYVPTVNLFNEIATMKDVHPDWTLYLGA